MGFGPAIGAAASLFGAGIQASAQARQAELRRQQAERDAEVAELAAVDTLQRGSILAGQLRARGTQVAGAQRVGFAAAGIDVGSQSVVNLAAGTHMLAELDALTAMNNAARQAWGYRRRAEDLRERGEAFAQQGGLAAAGTLLTGVAQAGASLSAGLQAQQAASTPAPSFTALSGIS